MSPRPQDDPLMNVRDVATMFDVKEITVREWLRLEKLKGTKVNGKWKVRTSAAIEYANDLYGSTA